MMIEFKKNENMCKNTKQNTKRNKKTTLVEWSYIIDN